MNTRTGLAPRTLPIHLMLVNVMCHAIISLIITPIGYNKRSKRNNQFIKQIKMEREESV